MASRERDPRVRVIHFRRNFGQTAAMMAGFDFARGDVIIPMDGDLQNDPADIPKLLAKLEEGYDVCSGWRKDRKDNALKRNLPSIMANRLISFVSGVRLHDFGCSLKAYRREVIEGRAALRRDAPLPADLRELARRAHHGGGGAALRAHLRPEQIRPGARAQGARRSARGEVPRPLSAEADVRLRRGRALCVFRQRARRRLLPSGSSSWRASRSSESAACCSA